MNDSFGAEAAPIAAPEAGLLLVDKPAGFTSHDVVARVRRMFHTRRVGHAGTLDPMATGLLLVGIGRATKLLGYLAGRDKTYAATITLGVATSTDDAEGEVLSRADATELSPDRVAGAMRELTGPIEQVPSAVSAIKVDGRRAYALVRAGEKVELAARPVTVSRFVRTGPPRPIGATLQLDVEVDCSTGTYIRALARDLGQRLGVGGSLGALRRTAIGPFGVGEAAAIGAGRIEDDQAAALRGLAQRSLLPVAQAARRAFDVRVVTVAETAELRFGRPLPAQGRTGVYAAVTAEVPPRFVALLEEAGDIARPRLVFDAAGL